MIRLLLLMFAVWLLGGCSVGIRAEGCDVLLVDWEGIREADALPVKPP